MSARRTGRLRAVAASAALLTVAALAGCSGTVSLEPAPQAGSPACAEIIVRLPDRVDGLTERAADAQSTAAWGSPASVLLRCGLTALGPTTMPCVTVDGVDWVRDDSNAPRDYRFITYGRSPATEVIIDDRHAAASSVLVDLASAVSAQPAVGHCVGADDPE